MLQQQMLVALLPVILVQHPLATVDYSMDDYAEQSKAFSAAEAVADVQLQLQAAVAKKQLQAADVQLSQN